MLTIFNTSWDLAGSAVDTALLPLGSVEPKGPHLPMGLDLILAQRFGRDLGSGRAVYLLPAFPFSTALEGRGFKGAVALSQETMWQVLTDLASNLARHGFKRLVVLDFSNFNWIVKQAVRELNLDRELIQAVWVNPKVFALEAAGEELRPDFGGGAVETSLAQFLVPDLVQTLPEDHLPDRPREYLDYAGLAAAAPQGYWGRPRSASAETGRQLYDLMLNKTSDYLDYALKLFPQGRPLEASQESEIWWPQGRIPGAQGPGQDWRGSLAQIGGAGSGLALIPTGAIEQHSPALPLATDFLQALEWSRRLADRLGAFLLPALPVVTSWGHIRFRGSLTFRAMTARLILEDLAESLRQGGFKKAVLVNVHGGNWVLKPTLIEINRRNQDFRLISTGDLLAYRGQAAVEQLHACEGEASFIRAFYPESFRPDQVVDHSPQCPASAFDLVGIGGVSPKGVWGYPSRARAEKGRADLEAKVDQAEAYVRRILSLLDPELAAGLPGRGRG